MELERAARSRPSGAKIEGFGRRAPATESPPDIRLRSAAHGQHRGGAAVYGFLALVLAIPLIVTYVHTGLVPRVPTAILVTGLGIVAVLCFFAGLFLSTVTRGRREVRRHAYLTLPAPGTAG